MERGEGGKGGRKEEGKEGRSRRLIEGEMRKRMGEQILELKRRTRKRVERKGRCEIDSEGEEE